jgi:hypothetical protein
MGQATRPPTVATTQQAGGDAPDKTKFNQRAVPLRNSRTMPGIRVGSRMVKSLRPGGHKAAAQAAPASRLPLRAIAVALVLAALCSLGFGSLRTQHPRARSSDTAPDERSTEATQPSDTATRSAPRTFEPPTQTGADVSPVRSNVMLENYKRYAMYPPTSRPVTQRRADAFKYNRRPIQYTPVRGDADAGVAFYSVFTADKFNVLPGETITLTLKATAAADSDANAYPIHILRSGLSLGRAVDGATVTPLDLRDDGAGGDVSSGDLTYTATVRPADVPTLATYHGVVRAFVEFSANGVTHGHQLFFNTSPENAVAAHFTGNFREAVEDGSLVVYSELDVLQAGYFDVDATLASRDGTAFCHSRFKGWLDEGRREARLLFFGKVIRDANPPAQSPFRLTELYGQMVPSPDRLEEATKAGDFAPSPVPLFDRVYVTRTYDASSFSDAEWQSTDKQNRLGNYNSSAGPRLDSPTAVTRTR